MSLMLAAENRLRDSASFRRAIRSGSRAGSALLVVHVLTPGGSQQFGDDAALPGSGEPTRAGLVVSKAVGDAVTRNRVKRRLRHLVRPELASVPPGSLVVVRALPAAAQAESEELKVQLVRSLSRATQRSAAA